MLSLRSQLLSSKDGAPSAMAGGMSLKLSQVHGGTAPDLLRCLTGAVGSRPMRPQYRRNIGAPNARCVKLSFMVLRCLVE
eukprot:7508201-Alexandrium_andersonii.AAC.1